MNIFTWVPPLSLLNAVIVLMDSIPCRRGLNSQSRVPSLSFSLSLPSEPPDVANWFSSYEYKSPDPDSNVHFEDSAFGGWKCNKDGERDGEDESFKSIRTEHDSSANSEDDEPNDERFLAKCVDSFSSRSVLSEPPEIGNWFSSYEYESPVFDTGNVFRETVLKESECEEEGFVLQDENKGLWIKQPSTEADGSVGMNGGISTADASRLGKIRVPCLTDRTLQHNVSSTKYEEKVSMNHVSVGCNREATPMSLNTNTSSDYICIEPPELLHKADVGEARSKPMVTDENFDISPSSANRFSAGNKTCLEDQEKQGDMKSPNGFVTTRKKRCNGANDENPWKRPEKILLQCTTNMGTVSMASEKHAAVKRKALSETTNLQQSNVVEVTGKWQCPQKNKSNVGPSLKQLRLEQWVHRV